MCAILHIPSLVRPIKWQKYQTCCWTGGFVIRLAVMFPQPLQNFFGKPLTHSGQLSNLTDRKVHWIELTPLLVIPSLKTLSGSPKLQSTFETSWTKVKSC